MEKEEVQRIGTGNAMAGGRVLVIGGGVAGIQASLDLADAGAQVFLVEKSPSIGGWMAFLDKTFPTNDCSICILAPKMADCFGHPNINVLTSSKVIGLQGEAGKFTARILRKSRFIDEEKCTGCLECVEKCPISVPNEFEFGLGRRKAIYIPFMQAVPRVVSIDRRGRAPCSNACPGGLSAQGYVALIRDGKYKEALDLIRGTVPLPSVCGRICHHPCEGSCNRKEIDAPVAIAALKSFVGDHIRDTPQDTPPPVAEKRKEKVAIVGAGPAGLTAAYQLALRGFQITVFEASSKPGGMLWWGIPEYRLPRKVLLSDVEYLLKAGIDIRYGVSVGKDVTLDKLRKEYNAVFIAIGAHRSLRLGVEGEDLKGVVHGTDFLRRIAAGKKVHLGKKVAVIGGGNAAMDAVRTARRLGSEAFILYRRTRDEMPAIPAEIAAAEEEGIKIHYLSAPVRILGEGGKVRAMECIRMELGEPDKSGRRRPIPVKGSEFTMDVDTIIPAVSQAPDIGLLGSEDLRATKWDTIEVNPDNLSTGIEGVFAGGDAVTGPASAIEAMAAGNKAAKYMERFLDGQKIDPDPKEPDRYIVTMADVQARMKGQITVQERVRREHLPLEKRLTTFEEVERVLTEKEALAEAGRCLDCGPCSLCGQCAIACKREAVNYDMRDLLVEVDVQAVIVATGFELWDPSAAREYGYGRFPNVYRAMEFERMLNASGPTGGHIQRRSDGQRPKKIAYIQCVGSRNPNLGHPYCCSVCCMHSTKEAMLAREHHDDMESTIFYKDLRTFGKGFNEYMERAKRDYGVKYINSDATVEENKENHNPIVVYDVAGKSEREEFDLVVLATTLVPRAGTQELSLALGIPLSEFKFFQSRDRILHPTDTPRDGIFLAGYCAGPVDIPESVAQGSAAASRAMDVLTRKAAANEGAGKPPAKEAAV